MRTSGWSGYLRDPRLCPTCAPSVPNEGGLWARRRLRLPQVERARRVEGELRRSRWLDARRCWLFDGRLSYSRHVHARTDLRASLTRVHIGAGSADLLPGPVHATELPSCLATDGPLGEGPQRERAWLPRRRHGRDSHTRHEQCCGHPSHHQLVNSRDSRFQRHLRLPHRDVPRVCPTRAGYGKRARRSPTGSVPFRSWSRAVNVDCRRACQDVVRATAEIGSCNAPCSGWSLLR